MSNSGKYTDYVKPDARPHSPESELPSSGKFSFSSLASHDSHPVKNYGQVSDSSSGGGRVGGPGRVRGGLTDSRQRNLMNEKSRDRGSDSRGFLSNHPPEGSQYDRHESSHFRSHGFNDGKPSYSHSIESPSSYQASRHDGLVADRSRYPSNSHYPSNGRDVLYGDSFYPASDDYYYAGGVAGPAGHDAGYDPQAPVNYDYYNVDPGVDHRSSPVKTIKHPHGGRKEAVTVNSATVKQVQHTEFTTVKLMSTDQRQQQAVSTVTTTTPHGHISTSSVAAEMSPSSPTGTTPSPQPSSLSSLRVEHKKPLHAARKHLPVSAEMAHSAMLWSTAGVKGAVVALTLGIIITLLTLAYIGCHYRHQRRISRRHRHIAPGSNDADYLVNGMYL